MLALDTQTLDILAIAGTATGVLGLLAAGTAGLRIRRLRRELAVLDGPDGARDSVLTAVGRQVDAVERLRGELARSQRGLEAARSEISDAIRHVAVVRYDAFGDMGGRLSFSAALLDDAGDGLVITSINGRSETRTYAKGVKASRSEQNLSPEEEQAIALAVRGEQPART